VILLFVGSWLSWEGRCIPLYLAIGWDGVLWTFCPGWPQTGILQIFASLGLQAWATMSGLLYAFCSFFKLSYCCTGSTLWHYKSAYNIS
jgi:hypothetical protein